jgi:hypothetical protein
MLWQVRSPYFSAPTVHYEGDGTRKPVPTATKGHFPLPPKTLVQSVARPSVDGVPKRVPAVSEPSSPRPPPCKRATLLEHTGAKLQRLLAPTPSQAPRPKAASAKEMPVARLLAREFDAVSVSADPLHPDQSLVFDKPLNANGSLDHVFSPTPVATPAPVTPPETNEQVETCWHDVLATSAKT